MSTKLTQREIMRDEIQELMHHTFNTIAAMQRELQGGTVVLDRRGIHEKLEGLRATVEQLRARVLPLIG